MRVRAGIVFSSQLLQTEPLTLNPGPVMSKITALMCICFSTPLFALNAPLLSYQLNGQNLSLSWSTVSEAKGYYLDYAPYPYSGSDSIQRLDLGPQQSLSAVLEAQAAYYAAISAYDEDNTVSVYSNIELIRTASAENNASDAMTLPRGMLMKSISGGTFTMGNNDLKGPQAGQAIEHTVTLSDYQMSETEVTNAQYVAFLNAAYTHGLITVTTGTDGPDKGLQLVTGTAQSSYADKVLYNLNGTRVMKDHDNADGDNNEFTGEIEPENPLNIAFIGWNETSRTFYVKDPHNPADFNWQEICNYYDYTSVANQQDKTSGLLKNDFADWAELNGWTETNPQAATDLPVQSLVAEYAVGFVRWWGAYAFADFYQLKLPTEAQWEYAAKGGQNFEYAVYDGISVNDANWNSDALHPARHHVREAKSGQANPYGLYNLGGNVWEWIADNYQAYTHDAVSDPLIIIEGSDTHSWRGGSWNYHQATLETAARYYDIENRGNDHFGFRVVDHQ